MRVLLSAHDVLILRRAPLFHEGRMLLGGSTTKLRHYQRKRWTELSRPYVAFETVVGTKGCLVAGTQDKEYRFAP